MSKDNAALVYAIAIGVVSSILAAALLEWRSPRWTWILLLLAVSMSALLLWLLWRNLQTLRRVGIQRWEKSLTTGTTTRQWIARSQRSVSFLGLDGTKWIEDVPLLRQMLVRHAANGGSARFLLLDPDSPACTEMEAIKQRERGSIARVIRRNSEILLGLRGEHLKLDLRYYSDTPRFRIVIVDDRLIGLALYSYASNVSDDSPQLILDAEPRPWSFYYAFNTFFASQWERARPGR